MLRRKLCRWPRRTSAALLRVEIMRTVRSLGADLAAVVTYDERMGEAAQAIGLPVVAPR